MRSIVCLTLSLCLYASLACATNGDTLIGVAPTARSRGGAVVAAPEDAISAIFANPAAICIGPYCPGSQAVVGVTLFDPTVRADVSAAGASFAAKSRTGTFQIPAAGLVMPVSDRVRFGLGAYGISGMGVDYRNSGIDLVPTVPGFEGDIFTQLQIMRLAPNIAYLVTPCLSLGASLHVVYGTLDLGAGESDGFTAGGQVGLLCENGPFAFGLTYKLPEKIHYEDVFDFDMDGQPDRLALESPQAFKAGVVFRPTRELLIETDINWHNWSDAAGYADFGWRDQWVYAVGAQYKHGGFALRAGYNYGRNPIKPHRGFDAAGTTSVQGKTISTLGYEYLRIVGFPAIAEHHISLGLGYTLCRNFDLHFGYTLSTTNRVDEEDASGTYSFRSSMRQDSYELGLVYNW